MTTNQSTASLGATVAFKLRHVSGVSHGVVIAEHPNGYRGDKPAIRVYDRTTNTVYLFHRGRGYRVVTPAPSDPAAVTTILEAERDARRAHLRTIPAWRDRLADDPHVDVFEGA